MFLILLEPTGSAHLLNVGGHRAAAHMVKLIKVVCNNSLRSLYKNVFPYLCEQVFHSTSLNGYNGIIRSGYICCGNDDVKSIWSGGFFKMNKCVSFSDYYHRKSMLESCKGLRKYRFYDQNGTSVSYHFVLSPKYYRHLITFFDIRDDWVKSGYKQILPFIESGIRENVPLSWFDSIVELKIVDEQIGQ